MNIRREFSHNSTLLKHGVIMQSHTMLNTLCIVIFLKIED